MLPTVTILHPPKEHRALELLRTLALERVVPFLQRHTRGTLARECNRRAKRSRQNLAAALASAATLGVAGLQDALAAHASLMGGLTRLFAIDFPEAEAVKFTAKAMEQWLVLEPEMEVLVAANECTPDLELVVMRAEAIKDVAGTTRQMELFQVSGISLCDGSESV